jgi:hypothetical protein
MDWNNLFREWQNLYDRSNNPTKPFYSMSLNNKDVLVVCLGDSWTWGDSLPDRENQFYCKHLADYYNADYINAGFPGYSNSWVLLIGNLILEKIKKLDYKSIIVAITLTENGRDISCPHGFKFDYIEHFKINGINADSYNLLLEKMQENWQHQLNEIIKNVDSRFCFFIGQNFIWHSLSKLTSNKSVSVGDRNWIEILADQQNMPQPIRTNLVTGWIFDQVNTVNSIANIIDTSIYKEWIIPYIDKAQAVNFWLDSSELNYKKASKHPTALGHKLWANYIINSLGNI